jgi:type IV pilus assembly protein PilA
MKRIDYRNQGFSLIELIVVMAILAVLVGAIAPALLRYVEKTRIAKDDSAASEIEHAVQIVVLGGSYEVTEQVLVTFSSAGISVIANTDVTKPLEEELGKIFGDYTQVVPCSKQYANAVYEIYIEKAENEDISITGEWNTD